MAPALDPNQMWTEWKTKFLVLFGVTVPKHYLTNYRDFKIVLSASLPILVIYDADANRLFKELGWDNLETRRQKLKAEMVYKSLNALASTE